MDRAPGRKICYRIDSNGINHLACQGRAVVAKPEHLPFRDCTFDFVLCIGVVQYLNRADELVKELARVAKRGGLVIVSSANKEAIARRIYNQLRHRSQTEQIAAYSVYEIADCFRHAQLRNLEFMGLHYPVPLSTVSKHPTSLIRNLAVWFALKGEKSYEL